jgi:branched-chain amino acid transport system ATP-binding protein
VSLLEVRNLDVHHGQLLALRDFSLTMGEGVTVAVIGANGAGKSTLLGALAGLNRATSGSVTFDGHDITRLAAYRRVGIGVALVPEGRRLFKSLTVEDNLLTGTYRARKGPWSVTRVMELFDWMPERRAQNASQLSGGEQQAVAIGRALVGNPRLLLIDELSLGLAPIVIQKIYRVLPRIIEEGTSVLIVEQDVSQGLRVADYVQCLLEGRTVLEGKPADLTMQQIESAYFGIDHGAAMGA